MRVAIVGSRGFSYGALIDRVVERLVELHGSDLVIVSGHAVGADRLAEESAARHGVRTAVFHPDWQQFGRSAGFRRNALIVEHSDVVFAFFAPGPRSNGTADTVRKARLAGKRVFIYHEGMWS
jgi:predicted Rossmann fold nucleotide-binding protein DprA/Smf involved in DNA uptake